MSKAICSECGSPVEIADGEEWGYCSMCENDQVEVKIGNSNGDFVDLLNKEMYELKIADLEAKLVESEEKKESYRLQNDEHHLQLCQFYSRLGVEAFGADIHEKALETLMIMKEQLAEKEKERHEEWKTGKEWKWEWQKVNQQLEQAHQDKISFAVEQLEKVKEWINNNIEENYGLNGSLFYVVNSSKLSEEIAHQIKQLKEMK